MQSFTCGCLCRRRVASVLDANFSKPIHAFYSYFLFFYFYIAFFFKRLIRGHCPGVPTSTFTEMRRLARDETPFPLAMQPRVTTLAW
jgi:hypothetical protein